MGISRIFDISRRSLASYQKALDVTSHNIANASNPNYSRQQVTFVTETPEVTSGMIWGTGVKIDHVQRAQNQLLEYQLLNNTPGYYSNEKQSELLGQIEQFFSEPTELGMSNLINGFFDSWNELAVTPNSVPLRNNVIYSAQKLASKVDSINDNLDIIKSDIVSEFKNDVDKLNNYLSQIQNLNKKIFEMKSIGTQPNDLLDERDKLIRQLSELANINVSYDSNNVASISIGGVFAVDGNTSMTFEMHNSEGQLSLRAKGNNNTVTLRNGEMYALYDVYSNKIPDYENQMDTMVSTIVAEVNALHSNAYTLEEPPVNGVNFFVEGVNGRLIINDEILDDPNKIAVSEDGTSGNGNIALQIADIADKKLINNLSISDAYSSLISGIANQKQTADELAQTEKLVIEQLELQKASYSGVSLDEEMSNVIKFQRSYDASAKMIKVADEMLETILNMV